MSNAQPCAEKIFINLNAPPAFQLGQKILGDSNANLHYIEQETKAEIFLRGRGSGFIELNGIESNEPLHLLIEHPALKNLIEAKSLAKNLIETIQQELQIFLQTNQQPNQQTVQIQQQPPPIVQTSNQQIPQAVLSCPPPIIQQPTHIIQQQNFIPQHQIIPHNIPMQIIQQTPPPRAAAPIVQFQGQAATLPANVQIQSANGGQQILLNQAPTQQYQLQYIPSTNQITNAPQMQTIQHVIQPQQQIQGIIQSGANGQQFITVQGNTAFMIPPPNIIHQNQPQNINAIFNPPPTLNLNQEEIKSDPTKVKQEGSNEQKNNQNIQQMGARIVTNIPINQPPPILNCPPPQIFSQQAPQQQIQQFIVNANGWPHQQLQQIPMNSQIQIVTQPQAIRNGNEIVLQSPITSTGQQVITYNPQQGSQPFHQIQFHQATISQPPPTQPQIHVHNIQSNHQNISFQQQFEQKINQSCDIQLQQRKRKFDSQPDAESSKVFPKTGMGLSLNERPSSPKAKNRMMTSNQPPNQQPAKLNVNNSGPAGASGDNMNKRNNQNKLMFNRNNNPAMSAIQKNVNTTAESKINQSIAKNGNESSDPNETLAGTQFTIQNHPNQSGFMMRPGNQNYRFQGPQNFIHQQPPPMTQNSQFSGPRGQIMSNSSMNMYQNVGQSQMMQPPPPTTVSHQFIHQDMNAYQQNNNFHPNNQQGSMNRFNVPQQQQQQHQQQQQQNQQSPLGGDGNNGMMTGNYQQPPRFRQW